MKYHLSDCPFHTLSKQGVIGRFHMWSSRWVPGPLNAWICASAFFPCQCGQMGLSAEELLIQNLLNGPFHISSPFSAVHLYLCSHHCQRDTSAPTGRNNFSLLWRWMCRQPLLCSVNLLTPLSSGFMLMSGFQTTHGTVSMATSLWGGLQTGSPEAEGSLGMCNTEWLLTAKSVTKRK